MNRRGMLKGLGALFGSAAVAACDTIKQVNMPSVEEVIEKAKNGVDFTDIDVLVYANEIQRRCSRDMNDVVLKNNAYCVPGIEECGLKLFGYLMGCPNGNERNLFKVHPYVKGTIVGYTRCANENTAERNKNS